MPKLKSFTFESCYETENAALVNFFQLNTQLRKLALNCCLKRTSQIISWIVQFIPDIKRIEFKGFFYYLENFIYKRKSTDGIEITRNRLSRQFIFIDRKLNGKSAYSVGNFDTIGLQHTRPRAQHFNRQSEAFKIFYNYYLLSRRAHGQDGYHHISSEASMNSTI